MMLTKPDMTVKPVPVGDSHHLAHVAFTGSHSWCPMLKAYFPLHKKSGSFPNYGRAVSQTDLLHRSMNFRHCFLHGCGLAFFKDDYGLLPVWLRSHLQFTGSLVLKVIKSFFWLSHFLVFKSCK